MKDASPLHTIVSGGQSGVDRAALDQAAKAGLKSGGWCPRGRRAEDGMIEAGHPLRETPSDDSAQRTEWNVRDSDATLILSRASSPSAGTELTAEMAGKYGRPLHRVDLEQPSAREARRWLEAGQFGVLNVAGPRESEAAGIYGQASKFLQEMLNEGPM